MQPKTATTITIILAILGLLFVAYFYSIQRSFFTLVNMNNKQNKELNPEKKKKQAIEIMNEVEKNNPTIIDDPIEKEKARLQAIEIMNEVEKNNPSKK